jgi:hypothetical protein
MSKLQLGTRVRTAAVLSAQDWSPEQNRLRQAGADGRIRAVCTPLDGSEPWYEVAHGPATTANYSAHELTPIHERATEAAAPTPEQERLERLEQRLEQRLTAAETEHRRFVDAVAVELVTLETRVERIERAEDSEQACRRGADRLNEEAAVAAARAWVDVDPELRGGTAEWIAWHTGHSESVPIQLARERAKDALEAIPELLRRLELLEQSPRRSRIQAWQALERACRAEAYEDARTESQILSALQVLDELPDDEPPPDSGERLAQGIRDLTCAPADVSPGDALEAAGWKMEEYGAAASALRVALSVPETKKVELGDLTTEMIRCYRRTTGQLARVRERLANMLGHAPDDITLSEMLAWIESRVMVVRDLPSAATSPAHDSGRAIAGPAGRAEP